MAATRSCKYLPTPIRRLVSRAVTAAVWLPHHTAYRELYFEIVGFCNAKCPYCSTGMRSGRPSSSKVVDIGQFHDTIDLLLGLGLIATKTIVSLYIKGEPLLHPKLNEILYILKDHGLHFSLSTNGSKFVSIDKNVLPYLIGLKFSMPGFSQDSYDRIHKLDFQRVVANIEMFQEDIRGKCRDVRLSVSYHVYHFSVHEIVKAREFCDSHDIAFNPYYPFLCNLGLAQSYLNRTMAPELLQRVGADLVLNYVDDLISRMPLHYRCPQFQKLAIDENCNVWLCCSLTKDHPDYCFGSIFDVSATAVRKMKLNQKICIECARSGASWWLQHPQTPRFFDRGNEIGGNLLPMVDVGL